MLSPLGSPQAPSIAPTIRSASSLNKGLTRQLNLPSPSPPRQALNTNLTALLRSAGASKPFAPHNNHATTSKATAPATAKKVNLEVDIFAASRVRKQHRDRMLRLRRLVSVALVVMASSAVSFYLLSASEHDMASAKLRAKSLKGSRHAVALRNLAQQEERLVYPGPYHEKKIKKLAKKKRKLELQNLKWERKLEAWTYERDRKRARVRECLLRTLSKDDTAMEVEPLDVMALLDTATSLSSLSSLSSFDSSPWSWSSSSSSSMDDEDDDSYMASLERDINAVVMQTALGACVDAMNKVITTLGMAFDTANEEAAQVQDHCNSNGFSGEMETGDHDDDNPFVDRPTGDQEDEDTDQTRELISFLTAAGTMLLIPPVVDGSEILYDINGATSLERKTRSRRDERGRSAFWALGLAIAGLAVVEDPEGEEKDIEEEWKGIQEEESEDEAEEEEEQYTLAGRLKLHTLLAQTTMSTALAFDIMTGRSPNQSNDVPGREEDVEQRQSKRRDTLSRALAGKLALGASKTVALEIIGKQGNRLGTQPSGKKAPFNFDPDTDKYDLDDLEDDEEMDDDTYETAEKNARTAIKAAIEAVEAMINATVGYKQDVDRDGESLLAEFARAVRGTQDGDAEMEEEEEEEEKRQLHPERMGRFDKKDRVTNWLAAVRTAPRTPGRTQGAGEPFKDISATPAINGGINTAHALSRPAKEAQGDKGKGKSKTSTSRPRRRRSEAQKAALQKAKDASKVARLRKKQEQEEKEKRKKAREEENARLALAGEGVKKKNSVRTRKKSRPSNKQLESLKKATEAAKLKRLQRKIAANDAA